MIEPSDLPNDFSGVVEATMHYLTSGPSYGCRIYDSERDIDIITMGSHKTPEDAESFALSEYKKELNQHRAEQRDYQEPTLSAWERNNG